ncbi:MAG: hypothetical protein GEU81_05090 [Nitriliruptorales bacterium]|nr:hypothetical protein [Nitriliruptorales bacterium]
MTVEFSRPTSVSAVIEELGDDDVLMLAGGVSLVLLMNAGFLRPRKLVSLAGVSELHGVSTDTDVLTVGAMCTHAELAADPRIGAIYPAAAAMFSGIGNVRVRSWGTLGGNLAHADPAQDPPVMLTALDARADVVGPGGQRELAIDELADGPLSPTLEPDEIVTRVRIPLIGEEVTSSYVKFLPGTKDDYATVSVGARIEFDDAGRITGARLAAGSVGPTVVPLTRACESLIGQHPAPDVMQAFQEAVRDLVAPQSDRRGSADYKREMAGVVAVRAVHACGGETIDRTAG